MPLPIHVPIIEDSDMTAWQLPMNSGERLAEENPSCILTTALDNCMDK